MQTINNSSESSPLSTIRNISLSVSKILWIAIGDVEYVFGIFHSNSMKMNGQHHATKIT
jgi:hypothetical protein